MTPLPSSTLDDLETKARAATPGPWEVVPDERENILAHQDKTLVGFNIYNQDGRAVVHDEGLTTDCEQDAAFIASCDPQTILSLIAQARRSEQAVAEAVAAEREACAVLADSTKAKAGKSGKVFAEGAAVDIAAAIRARPDRPAVAEDSTP